MAKAAAAGKGEEKAAARPRGMAEYKPETIRPAAEGKSSKKKGAEETRENRVSRGNRETEFRECISENGVGNEERRQRFGVQNIGVDIIRANA